MMIRARGGATQKPLGRLVMGGLAWSTVSTVFLRLGGVAVGIAIARLLTPTEFGIYAVALTVQSVLVAVADLGLSADLIRHKDARQREPMVATIAASVSLVLTIIVAVLAAPLATALGAPDAAPAIAILSVTVLLAGLGVVPFARLQRDFKQRELFVVGAVDFALSTAVTIGLVILGWGVIGLAVGRAVAQAVSSALMFILAHVRPRFGFDRKLLRSIVGFGAPVAGANVLSWSVFGIDKVILSRLAGPTVLGYFVLSFNISAWPMSLLGQAMRAVALPLFSRRESSRDRHSLGKVIVPVWTLAALAAAAIAATAQPLVSFIYGEKWEAAAGILPPLAILGGLRVLFDLFAAYLYARGKSGRVLLLQVAWFVSLTFALVIAVPSGGGLGAAYAHAAVSVLVVLPLYVWMTFRAGADLGSVLDALWRPAVAAVLAGLIGFAVTNALADAFVALALGGVSVCVVYGALVGWWATPRIRDFLATGGAAADQA